MAMAVMLCQRYLSHKPGSRNRIEGFQTEMPVRELEAHFGKQLASAGWRRLAGAADETTGWSSWDVPNPGGWRGFLLVVSPFPGWRSMSVRVETIVGGGTGGWSSTVSSTLG